MSRRHGPLAVAVLLFLAGCAHAPPRTGATVPWPERDARLLDLRDWEARGRFAVKSPDAGRSGQGNLQWSQAGPEARIHLSGPFGTGAVDLDWGPDQLTVTTGGGSETRQYAGADGAAGFVAAELGFSFPVASIRYWLLALADPAAPVQAAYDADGRLATLGQSGWQIRYDDYRIKDELWLPRRIEMESGVGRLRLVIDDWQF